MAKVIETLERNHTYRPTFVVEPSLSAHQIYPYDLGAGDGLPPVEEAQAYYDLMGFLDGKTDMLGIADRLNRPITIYDRPLKDFLRTGLAETITNKPVREV